MLYDLYNILISSAKILSSPQVSNKMTLIFTYARLRIKNRLLLWMKKNATTEQALGLQVSFFNYSSFVYLFEEIFVRQTYFFSTKNPKPTIIDCGSNIGLSVLFLKKLYPDAHVLAFEPDPKTFQILQKNIQDNHISGVELFNQANMDHKGTVEFYTDANIQGSLSMSTIPTRGGQNKQEVPCGPISPFITGPIDFLKMDIEGAESQCIQELRNTGRLGQIREMIIECHHNMSDAKVLSNILPTLDSQGYKYQISAQPQNPYQFKQDVMVHAVLE